MKFLAATLLIIAAMDVKFDSFPPYSGILPLDAATASDVTFYTSSPTNSTGTLASTSAAGAFSLNARSPPSLPGETVG